MRSQGTVVLLLVLTPGVSWAQAPRDSLRVGQRVRIHTNCKLTKSPPCEKLAGTLEGWNRDTLRMLLPGEAAVRAVPLTSVQTLERFAGRGSAAGDGAVIGSGVGMLLGVVLGTAIRPPDPNNCGFVCVGGLYGMGVGTLAGAIVGAMIGLSIETDRWREVPVRKLRLTPSPVPGAGVGLALKVTF